MEVVLQRRDGMAKFLEIGIAHSTEMAISECARIALVFARADRVQSDEFARHGETGNLVVSATVRYAGFQEPAVNDKQRLKLGSGTVQVFVMLYRTAVVYPVIELPGLGQGKIGGQTPGIEGATSAFAVRRTGRGKNYTANGAHGPFQTPSRVRPVRCNTE